MKYLFKVVLFFFIPTSLQVLYANDINKTFHSLKERIDIDRAELEAISHTASSSISKDSATVDADEKEFTEIEKELLFKFSQMLQEKDFKSAKKFLSPKFKTILYSNNKETKNIRDGVKEHSWRNKKGSFNEFAKHLKSFDKIVDLNFYYTNFKSHKNQRGDVGQILAADIVASFDLRTIKNGKRVHERGDCYFNVELKNKKWQITALNFGKGKSLEKTSPSFIENKTAFKSKIPNYQRVEAIRRGGYSLSLSDYNKDGNTDMYIGARGSGLLLSGDGKGSFKADKKNPLRKYNLVKSSFFADFNNDGLDDLLLVRFNNRGSDREQKFKEEIVLYQNLGAKKGFKEIKNFYPLKDRLKAMPAAIADFNGDGLLDFYVGYPGAKDFTFMDAHMPKNSGNDVQGLYYNQGNFKFKEVSSEAIKDKRLAKSQEQILFPHSSLAADIDMDNDMDLIIIDDRGNLSPIYANNGLGEFSPIHQKIHVSNDDYGMGFAIGDLDNDGILDVLYSNVNFYASQRLLNSGLLNHDYSYAELKGLNGLKVYKGSKSKSFIDITKSSIDFDPGEGVAGVEMIDFNNDGFLDIYVTNGLWSGSDRGQDLSSLFMRADRNTPFNTSLGDNRESFKESQSEFMAILRQFKGDINNKKSKSSLRPSMAGHQRNRLYRNNGDSTFTEVGFLEGVDSLADGYMVTKADLNNDGKLDIVLRNCDPGTEIATFAPVQVFINNHKNKNSLRLKLIGKRSNRNGIGAHVTAYIGKRKIIQHLLGSNGTVQSEKIIHIGLENKSKADRVVITWPSGNRSELKNLKSGFHKIIEPGAQKTIVLNK